MASSQITKLRNAVREGNVTKVSELLRRDQKDAAIQPYSCRSILKCAQKLNRMGILKLLVEYVIKYGRNPSTYVFENLPIKDAKIILPHMIQENYKNKTILRKLFYCILLNYTDPEIVDLLELLILNGLPIDGNFKAVNASLTPLQFSILFNNNHVTSFLLHRGADIHATSGDNLSALYIAARFECNPATISLLLSKGARVNEACRGGETALHGICKNDKETPMEESLCLLLDHGADPNILNEVAKTPLMVCVWERSRIFLIKWIAKMIMDGQFVCNENLIYLKQQPVLQNYFDRCLLELHTMKNMIIFSTYSMYDVYKMRNNPEKLTWLTKSIDFITNFNECKTYFTCYAVDLANICKDALQRRDILQVENEKINFVLKDHFPESVITRILAISKKHLFNEPLKIYEFTDDQQTKPLNVQIVYPEKSLNQ